MLKYMSANVSFFMRGEDFYKNYSYVYSIRKSCERYVFESLLSSDNLFTTPPT